MMAVRRRERARGLALGTTLACVMALAVILFAAAGAGVSHLKMVSASNNADHARNLAEAALSSALAELAKGDFQFGKDKNDRIAISVADLPGSLGVVSFNKHDSGFTDRYSTFNLDGDQSVPGAAGRQVPVRTVHLIARGKVGESESWVECLYYKPPFPDGLVSTGPVVAKSLYLAGVRRGGAYSGGEPGSIDPEESVPANLFTNATDGAGAQAVRLQQNCRIQGSVGASGSVILDVSSVVDNEVLPNSQPRAIPEIDIVERMEALRPNAVVIPSSGRHVTLEANWFAQATSGLNVSGDLSLNGSVLLVDGDLTVGGAILGTGIILVDGKVTILDGHTSVISSDQVAIACTKNFLLQADKPEGNYFQGLVYCEGDLTAKDITVVGATVVNGQGGAQGAVSLDNVRFVQSPGSTSLELISPVGDPAGAQSWAVSLNLKPDPSGEAGAFLSDVRAYFTDKDEVCERKCTHSTSACKNKEIPLNWATKVNASKKIDRFSSWNSKTGEVTVTVGELPGVTTRTAGAVFPEGIPTRLYPDGEIELFDGGTELAGLSSREKQEKVRTLFDTSGLDAKAMELKIANLIGANRITPSPLAREVAEFMEEQSDAHDNAEPAKRAQKRASRYIFLNKRVARAIPSQQHQSVTFNLNNLLGEELLASSRVLLWRPLR